MTFEETVKAFTEETGIVLSDNSLDLAETFFNEIESGNITVEDAILIVDLALAQKKVQS